MTLRGHRVHHFACKKVHFFTLSGGQGSFHRGTGGGYGGFGKTAPRFKGWLSRLLEPQLSQQHSEGTRSSEGEVLQARA